MSGESMRGTCGVCGKKDVPLSRTYFRYDIPCSCHSPEHFICIDHCKDCVPKEPIYTKVEFKTEDLKDPYILAQKIIDFANKRKAERETKNKESNDNTD